MQLDVVIDVVCPWCYVGKKQLDKALEQRPGVISALRWRPFQLAPDTPKEGVDRAEHYKKKFGGSEKFTAMREHLRQQGDELGIDFDFDSTCRIANTLDAHRLIRWSYAPGVQNAVVEDIMKRYFEDCAFLGDLSLLVDVAEKAGMDGALVKELLASDKDVDVVHREIIEASQMGIQGVPMFIFDGKSGVSGAQPADVLVSVMDKLVQNAAAE
ncbi:MAG: disulfide bond formation protein DsbA [Kordiimonadales bacterium]|nr:MAG: disulfide bond formation protein DsbA [Kordiimonadales bacterium]